MAGKSIESLGRIIKLQYTRYQPKWDNAIGKNTPTPTDFSYALDGFVNGRKMRIYSITYDIVLGRMIYYIKVYTGERGDAEVKIWKTLSNLVNEEVSFDCEFITEK